MNDRTDSGDHNHHDSSQTIDMQTKLQEAVFGREFQNRNPDRTLKAYEIKYLDGSGEHQQLGNRADGKNFVFWLVPEQAYCQASHQRRQRDQ